MEVVEEAAKEVEDLLRTSPRWSASRSTASVTEHPLMTSRACLRNTVELVTYIFPKITEPRRAEALVLSGSTARMMPKMPSTLLMEGNMMEES